MTPPEVFRLGEGAPDTEGWHVRVVPNLYPAVGGDDAGHGATGYHEVIIASPAHDRSLGQLDDVAVVELFTALRDRSHSHVTNGHTYVQAIVNHGRAAGASIEHPHAQIFALDVLPPLVVDRLERFAHAKTDLVTAELAHAMNNRLAVVTGPAIAWCPPGSSFAYQMRVAHRSTRARFDEAADTEIAIVALATRDALARLAATVGDVAYNVVVNTAPTGPAAFFHWWIDIRPRLSTTAGFEQGTGIYINSTAPEDAAAALNGSSVSEP